jgi:hypothetical protein
MATYDVEVFRVVRLAFVNIEAESAESAALVADAKARDLTDCILVTKSPADAGAIEVLPAGTLRKVTDGYVNTEFVVDLVRSGVPQREGRIILSQRFAPNGQSLGVSR